MIHDWAEYNKQYYQENIKNKYLICECGKVYLKYHKKSHEKSKKHKKIMNNK